MGEVATTLHSKIGEVFEHYDVILRSKFADDLQLFFFERDPCRIVRVAIDDSSHIAILQLFLKLSTKRLSAVREDVKLLPFDAEYAEL